MLVATYGGPLTTATAASQFNKYRGLANGDNEWDRAKRLHNLRGTYTTKLMSLPGKGLTDNEIALIISWEE